MPHPRSCLPPEISLLAAVESPMMKMVVVLSGTADANRNAPAKTSSAKRCASSTADRFDLVFRQTGRLLREAVFFCLDFCSADTRARAGRIRPTGQVVSVISVVYDLSSPRPPHFSPPRISSPRFTSFIFLSHHLVCLHLVFLRGLTCLFSRIFFDERHRRFLFFAVFRRRKG